MSNEGLRIEEVIWHDTLLMMLYSMPELQRDIYVELTQGGYYEINHEKYKWYLLENYGAELYAHGTSQSESEYREQVSNQLIQDIVVGIKTGGEKLLELLLNIRTIDRVSTELDYRRFGRMGTIYSVREETGDYRTKGISYRLRKSYGTRFSEEQLNYELQTIHEFKIKHPTGLTLLVGIGRVVVLSYSTNSRGRVEVHRKEFTRKDIHSTLLPELSKLGIYLRGLERYGAIDVSEVLGVLREGIRLQKVCN